MSQGTQLEVEVQHVDIGANRLLGLVGVAVQLVELAEDGARVVHVSTAQDSAAACPVCGVVSTSVKGHARTRPRDLPYGTDPVGLVWHKRRWRCQERLCPRGSFTESLPSVPARSRLTTRLRQACGVGVAEDFKDVQAAARYHGVSWPVAHAAFIDHVTPALVAPLPPVCVLGIDETRRGKIKWAQDPVTGRWQVVADRWLTGIVDAHGTGGLLGHVDGRASAGVIAWLEAQPASWRQGSVTSRSTCRRPT